MPRVITSKDQAAYSAAKIKYGATETQAERMAMRVSELSVAYNAQLERLTVTHQTARRKFLVATNNAQPRKYVY